MSGTCVVANGLQRWRVSRILSQLGDVSVWRAHGRASCRCLLPGPKRVSFCL
jgi:hypothetical protein